jgi:hypothetical protein
MAETSEVMVYTSTKLRTLHIRGDLEAVKAATLRPDVAANAATMDDMMVSFISVRFRLFTIDKREVLFWRGSEIFMTGPHKLEK